MSQDALHDPARMAEERFAQGFNCAQAVFSAFADRYRLDATTALKLASPFGGGVARRGQVCGAVTGALLALALARGASTPEGKEQAYLLAQEFLQKFEARRQTILCRDLLGYDISQPEERQQARQAGAFENRCPLFVREAAAILQEMLDPTGQ